MNRVSCMYFSWFCLACIPLATIIIIISLLTTRRTCVCRCLELVLPFHLSGFSSIDPRIIDERSSAKTQMSKESFTSDLHESQHASLESLLRLEVSFSGFLHLHFLPLFLMLHMSSTCISTVSLWSLCYTPFHELSSHSLQPRRLSTASSDCESISTISLLSPKTNLDRAITSTQIDGAFLAIKQREHRRAVQNFLKAFAASPYRYHQHPRESIRFLSSNLYTQGRPYVVVANLCQSSASAKTVCEWDRNLLLHIFATSKVKLTPSETEAILEATGCQDRLHPVDQDSLSLYYRQWLHSKNENITKEVEAFLSDLIVNLIDFSLAEQIR